MPLPEPGTRDNPIIAHWVRLLDLDHLRDLDSGEPRIVLYLEFECNGHSERIAVTPADAREFGRRLVEAAELAEMEETD